jgi:type I restriction enzyme, S subunit
MMEQLFETAGEGNEVEPPTAYPPSVQPGIPTLGKTPIAWVRLSMGELLEPVMRPADLKDHVEYQLVTAKRNRGGIVPRERLCGRDIKTKTQAFVNGGDFLISRRQISHGACGLVPDSLSDAVVSNEYSVIKPKDDLDLKFLQHLTHSVYFQQTCFHSSIGVHVEKLVFKLDDWLRWKFDIPVVPEQCRIAAVLNTWDCAIATTEELITAKRRRKAGLTRRLLHEGRDRTGRLGDLADVNPSSSRIAPEVLISFVAMEDVSEDGRLLRHHVRRRAELGSGYTAFRDNDLLVAKITPCFENHKGAHVIGLHGGVGFGSTEFHVIRPHDPRDARFIYHHVMADAFRKNGERYMTGSAGQRRVPAEFIEDYRIAVLSSEERQRAAQRLNAADQDLDVLIAERERFSQQKRGLMQKLLTGTWRLNGDEMQANKLARAAS